MRIKEHFLGFTSVFMFSVGCAGTPDHKLPGATNTPHLDSAPSSVACGDDVALYGNTTPDIRYLYTYDTAGRIAHVSGAYATGGADDSIDYTFDGSDNLTHLLEQHGWGDSRVEITAGYGANGLTSYTYDASAPDWHDNWTYSFSDFLGVNQPSREVIAETDQGSWGYTLGYDAFGRLTTATPDDGTATTWAYDDDARTIAVDYGNGAWHETITYDDQDRELSDVSGGSDPQAIATDTAYDWTGERLNSAVFQSGTEQAPKQLELVETDTLRYDCSMARVNAGRVIRIPKQAVRR